MSMIANSGAGGVLDPVAVLQGTAASARTAASRQAAKDPRLAKQAQDFETMFLETTLGHLTSGLTGDGPLGGGSVAQDTWRGMLTQQYAKTIATRGGVGLADSVYRELVRMQAQSGAKGPAAKGGVNAA